MFPAECVPSRRNFLKTAAAFTTAASGIALMPQPAFSADSDINIIGPKSGYSPQIGTLVSMMAWMRTTVLSSVKGMTQKDLDYLIDNNANSIGALLLHLAATDAFYHAITMGGISMKELPESFKEKWGMPMELGEPARKGIRGHDLEFYLNIMKETREETLAEFRKRDDDWLMKVDKDWPWGPTNNYCKWFHVCEHESNHNGQIKFLAKRLPGAKAGSD
ncbi:MAG TPA: DinB family protein [Candidatus Sulfotelmatobacter sp.]|nr:DinB family protein [Candidatus Sulfotelmatobacter sp.]